jgi:hypothetical protein
VLARRVIVLAADKGFAKQLTVAAKAAGGSVDTHATLEELGAQVQAALVIVHLDGALAAISPELLARLTGDTRVIAVLPQSNLVAVVSIMLSSERLAGILVAESFKPNELSAMATRVVAGDIFGLEKSMMWGSQVHSILVGDYNEKAVAISQVSEFAELMGVRRKYRESIDQCLDEMLMNALYDAPVDENGKPIFADIPTKTRISLRMEQKAVVQYACDGSKFVIAVRDAFGTLERSTVLHYLHKCLHQEQQIDRKAGGAGLGLYLMASSASSVMFNVLPGVATEAVCRFDLDAPKPQLDSFGFFVERIDAAGRLASGPSRRLPGSQHPVERRAPDAAPQPKALIAVLILAIVATLALVLVAAWPRLFGAPHTAVTVRTVPAGAAIEVEGKTAGVTSDGSLVVRDLEIGRPYSVVARLDGYEPRQAVLQPTSGDNGVVLTLDALAPTVRIESTPQGASVEIDGKPAGLTPLTLTKLPAGKTIELALKKNGYQPVSTKLDIPGPGKETRLIQPLNVSDELARVRLTSEPSGAQVVQNGQVLAGVTTPAEVLVEASKPVHFTLTLPGKLAADIEPFTPGRGAQGIVRSGKLVDGVELTVSSNVDGKVSLKNVDTCQDQPTPSTCLLAPGPYTLELVVASDKGNGKVTKKIKLGAGAQEEKLTLGFVEAPPNHLLELNGTKAKKLAVETGTRKIAVLGTPGHDDPKKDVTVSVVPGATVIAQ